jgi:hypothetical protein
VSGAQYSVCYSTNLARAILTLESLLLSLTDRDSSPTSHMRRYSPEVAIKSLWVPFYIIMIKNSLTYHIGNPHNLGRRVLMVEVRTVFEVVLFLIQLYDLYFILSVLDE